MKKGGFCEEENKGTICFFRELGGKTFLDDFSDFNNFFTVVASFVLLNNKTKEEIIDISDFSGEILPVGDVFMGREVHGIDFEEAKKWENSILVHSSSDAYFLRHKIKMEWKQKNEHFRIFSEISSKLFYERRISFDEDYKNLSCSWEITGMSIFLGVLMSLLLLSTVLFLVLLMIGLLTLQFSEKKEYF